LLRLRVRNSSQTKVSNAAITSNWLLRAPRLKSAPRKTVSEQRELTEAMASIQLHAMYQDPLEEWRKQNQKEAFVCNQPNGTFIGS